ncbi:unnamed protein product [Prunus armeniaca]
MQDICHHPQAALLKKMWGLKVPPKVKIFSWLLIRKRLQVRGHLHRFLPQINPKCPFVISTGKPFLTSLPLATLLKAFGAALAWLLRSLLQTLISSPDWVLYRLHLTPQARIVSPKLFCYAGRFGKQGTT